MYQADGKPMTWGFVANKKEYSYWLIGIVGIEN
jgi:hypothetical protein